MLLCGHKAEQLLDYFRTVLDVHKHATLRMKKVGSGEGINLFSSNSVAAMYLPDSMLDKCKRTPVA